MGGLIRKQKEAEGEEEEDLVVFLLFDGRELSNGSKEVFLKMTGDDEGICMMRALWYLVCSPRTTYASVNTYRNTIRYPSNNFYVTLPTFVSRATCAPILAQRTCLRTLVVYVSHHVGTMHS